MRQASDGNSLCKECIFYLQNMQFRKDFWLRSVFNYVWKGFHYRNLMREGCTFYSCKIDEARMVSALFLSHLWKLCIYVT